MKAKKRRTRRIIIIVVIVVIVLIAAVVLLRSRRNSENSSSSGFGLMSVTTTEETETVSTGTIRISAEGNGSIEAADQEAVIADYTLQIDQVEAENGDSVSEGEVIATLDEDSVEDQIDLLQQQLSEVNSAIAEQDSAGSSSLTSPISGRVKRIYVKSGDVLSEVTKENGGVMELSADEKLKIEIKPSENLKLGETVTVSFLSYEVDGTVQSKEGDTYTIVFDDSSSYLVDTEASVTNDDDTEIGTGTIQSNQPYLIEANYGIADEIEVAVGDSVSPDTTLLTRTDVTYNSAYLDLLSQREEITDELSTLREMQQSLELTAPSDGIVSNLLLEDGEIMSEGMPMYTLISTDEFSLKVEIDELDIDGIEVGQTATIVFDAFDTEEYKGTVEKISALGTNIDGVTTYTVTISVPGEAKLKTAMSATATIITEEKSDVLLIPVDAIQTSDGKTYVTVVKGEDKETTEVTLGLVNNTEAEVTSGLSEGDVILITTETSFLDNISGMQQSMMENLQGGE